MQIGPELEDSSTAEGPEQQMSGPHNFCTVYEM